MSEFSPASEAAWLDSVPLWLSNFSRYFGPLLPDILQRNWLVCDPEPNLLTRPFVELSSMDKPVAAVEELKALELASGDRWKIVHGEYLTRLINHIDEDSLTFLGIPDQNWDQFWADRRGTKTRLEVEKVAENFCDLAFCNYEGIWAAFFADPRLLARTFFHCSEYFSVLEIEDGVGIFGNWLTRCRSSCPNLPILLAQNESGGE